MNGIDAPEARQDFYQVSKKHLSDLVFGKDVRVLWSKIDIHRRLIGTVLIGDVNANVAQLEAGLAWYFRQYARDVPAENRPAYERAEADAREAKRGLWSFPNPTPPWIIRHPTPGRDDDLKAAPIIGNRNSTIYHLANCPDYEKVAERNRVYFETTEEAEKAGFRKARNCP